MPEGVGYGPQFTASVGETLNIIGDHAYAYSGVITYGSSTPKTFLKFTTGNFYFVGEIALYNNEGGNSDIFAEVKLNGSIIVKARWSQPTTTEIINPIPIMIPSFTDFEGLMGADVSQDLTMTLTGRLYGKVDK